MPLTNFVVAGAIGTGIVMLSLAAGAMVLKHERKHKLITPSKGCYAWHDGRVQCNPLMQETQCPPVWKCNGRQETNDPRCCVE